MPWKECSAVEVRLVFVARLIEGEAMTDLCREFGVSRKTGYKILTISSLNISTSLAGQKLGIKEVDDGIWLVSFMATT